MQPKYNIGQLLMFAMRDGNESEFDLGMIINVHKMKNRIFGHYTYDIQWFADWNIKHQYIEEDTLDEWVSTYISFRKKSSL